MSNRPRKQALKVVLFNVFICLLLWSLGAGVFPVSTVQDSESRTPTNTQADETQLESPTPKFTTAATPTTLVAIPSVTQTVESTTTDANRVPLPAIFATGAYVPGELIVGFKSSTSAKRIDECFQTIDVHIQMEIEELHALVLGIDSGEVANTFYQILNWPKSEDVNIFCTYPVISTC